MNNLHHQLDAQLAALDNPQIETLWRQAVERGDHDNAEPLARQLVLRALPALESACHTWGSRNGMSEPDIAAGIREASVKLMLRLLHHSQWSSLTGLAAQIAREVIDDPRRRRRPVMNDFAPTSPVLRLIHDASRPDIHQIEDSDNGRR
jgi:hypothetical protein